MGGAAGPGNASLLRGVSAARRAALGESVWAGALLPILYTPRGDRSRHRGPAWLRGLRARNRHAAAAELAFVHVVETQAVVEQHLALGGVGHVLPPEQGGDGPGIGMAVVARLAAEERVEEIGRAHV